MRPTSYGAIHGAKIASEMKKTTSKKPRNPSGLRYAKFPNHSATRIPSDRR